MSDEEKKARYIRIVKKLKLANNKMYTLINSLDSLANSLNKNINVDGKGYDSEKVKDIKEKVDTLQDKNINIINSLVYKINHID
ncbi:MAG: hypothetical protein IJL76_03800 [Bacilli bacterium]|nr:hypothetical protein [Bacilli bacterium]